jgi:hypothetical protein
MESEILWESEITPTLVCWQKKKPLNRIGVGWGRKIMGLVVRNNENPPISLSQLSGIASFFPG